MSETEPGWQPDPTGRFQHRYWDGHQWTEHVSNAGVASTDPYTAGDAGGDATVTDAPAATAPPTAPVSGTDQPAAEPTAPVPGTDGPTAAEPTAVWPAPADPGAAAAPPVPPAYVGPPATPDGSPSGSKKGLLIGGGILAAVIAAVAAFLLLGGDDDGGDRARIRAAMASQIRQDSELTKAQAECVADAVIDEMGTEKLKDVDFSADEPPEAIADDLFKAAFASLEKCDIDPDTFGGGDTSDGDGTYGSDPDLDDLYDRCADGDYQACDDLFNESPSGSEYEEFGDTCGGRNDPAGYCVELYSEGGGSGSLPDGFEQQLADIYESSLGLSPSQARCLAGKIADAIDAGKLSEDEAMSDIFSYLSDCDISLDEING